MDDGERSDARKRPKEKEEGTDHQIAETELSFVVDSPRVNESPSSAGNENDHMFCAKGHLKHPL